MQCMYYKLMHGAIYVSKYFTVHEQAHYFSQFLLPHTSKLVFRQGFTGLVRRKDEGLAVLVKIKYCVAIRCFPFFIILSDSFTVCFCLQDSDSAYADTLLAASREMFDFANNYRRVYHESITNAADFYR